MNEEQIISEIKKALLVNSETPMVEFKNARGGFPKTTTRNTLSAFGNTKGGVIVFGVEEKKDKTLKVVGTNNIAELQEKMSSLSSEEMSEVLRLDYHHIEIQNEIVLAVYVPECKNRTKPYYIKALGMPRGAYIRDGNTDRQMTADEMRSYVRNAQIDNFDNNCADDATKDDLSLKKNRGFFTQKS